MILYSPIWNLCKKYCKNEQKTTYFKEKLKQNAHFLTIKFAETKKM